MPNQNAFRIASALAGLTVALIATGPALLMPHRALTVLLLLGAIALAVMTKHRLAWANVVLLISDGGLARLGKISPWGAVAHEVVGLLSLALVGAIAVMAWPGVDPTVEDSGKPSLRTLLRITPPAILCQVLLGAMYRAGIIGIAGHIVGAMLVGGLIMFAGISVMILPGAGKALLRVAGALLGVTFVQFMLGIYAYLSRIGADEAGMRAGVSVVAVSHIATGALTMGLSVVLAILVYRYVRSAEAGAA